jgi:hypothetical protein
MFFVSKKNGKLRLIIDCRRVNQLLRLPPRTPLASSAAFAEVQAPEGSGLYYTTHDVADCFYQFRTPRRLAVVARDVGVTSIDGTTIEPDRMIVPLIDVLPMRFSFALHWAQKAHECALRRANVSVVIMSCSSISEPPQTLKKASVR